KVADDTLRERFRKSALREKEKRSAKAAEEEAAAQAEKRAAKLNQLAERFNRNRG
ncbi:MAG: osmoprotectant transporter activator, partial [Rhodocyclaceae bacterium]|nr:osmoprotectant transporter activator [Rhodocyclaceae bacterium]